MTRLHLRNKLPSPKIVVVKVGSRILTSDKHLERTKRIRSLVDDIVGLKKSGIKVVLVSSGAIAQGVRTLALSRRPTTIPMKQACASIGQIQLMNMYDKLFAHHDTTIGQVLLSWADLRNKTSFLNLRNTLFTLLKHNIVPIINENDSIGIDEIKIGDNDTLAAQISLLVGADLYVILTDINGLYNDNPRKNPDAQHIPLVTKFSSSLHDYAGEEGSSVSVGGMITKLKAAEIVCKSGIPAIIGDGYTSNLASILTTESTGTLFLPAEQKMPARQRWITFTGKPAGSLVVDNGARQALVEKGKSLLAVGIKKSFGTYNVGDMVDITDENKSVFARGIVNFKATDVDIIKGLKSTDIEKLIGAKTFDCVVHRDNLFLL